MNELKTLHELAKSNGQIRAAVVAEVKCGELICEARTRRGTPYQAQGRGRGGRCHLHGRRARRLVALPQGRLSRKIRISIFALAACLAVADPVCARDTTFFDRVIEWFNPSQATGETATADVVPYSLIVAVNGSRAVREAVTEISNLERLKRSAPSGAAGLLRRALADRERIIAALYSEGHYAGTLHITVAGRRPDAVEALDAVEAARRVGPVPVRVHVEAGPLFTFGTVRLLDKEGSRPLPDPPSERRMRLVTGEPAKAIAVTEAERVIIVALREKGHPLARIAAKDVVADHDSRTLDVTLRVDPGPRATFGRFTVSTTGRLNPDFIAERIDIRPGERYSPERLALLRKRLATYESVGAVRFREATEVDAYGQLPIIVEVSERDPRFVGFGATYSSTEGAVANVFWGHRNLFGGGETLRFDARASWFGMTPEAVPDADPFGYLFAATFAKPGILTANDDFVAQAAVLREVTNAYVRDSATFLGGARHRFDDALSAQASLDVEQSQVSDTTGRRDDIIVGLPVDVTFDTTDSLLDASRGVRFSGVAEPFAMLGQSGAGPLLVKGTLSAYQAFDEEKRYILAGRVSAGTILGSDLLDVPPQRRFYVGGGGSLRGFGYQAASPRDAAGTIIGGLSYFTASVEMRMKVTDAIGIVPFFDMGAAFASELPNFEQLRYAAGIGLRYYTAIGPVRLDLAIPLNPDAGDAGFGVYISFGQSF